MSQWVCPRGLEVHLIGFVARSGDHSDSDIDLAVTVEPDASYFDFIAIQAELCDLLGRDVDVLSMDGMRNNYEQRPTMDSVATVGSWKKSGRSLMPGKWDVGASRQ